MKEITPKVFKYNCIFSFSNKVHKKVGREISAGQEMVDTKFKCAFLASFNGKPLEISENTRKDQLSKNGNTKVSASQALFQANGRNNTMIGEPKGLKPPKPRKGFRLTVGEFHIEHASGETCIGKHPVTAKLEHSRAPLYNSKGHARHTEVVNPNRATNENLALYKENDSE